MKSKKISIIDCSHEPERHNAPWMVRYYELRKPVREFFATRALAETRRQELQKLLRKGLDPQKMSEINRLVAGTGYDPAELIKTSLSLLQANGGTAISPTALFREGAAIVIRRAEENAELAPETLAGYRVFYEHINRVLGDRTAICITVDEVKKFLDSLPDQQRRPGKAAVATKRTYAVMIKMALKALGIVNPLKGLPRYRDRAREVRFYSVEDVRTMFASVPEEERGLLALAVFGILRPQLLGKLPADCVNVEERTITIPAYLAKDRKGHCLEGEFIRPDTNYILPGLPNVLWDWLRIYPFKPKKWVRVQVRLKAALGGRWIQDGLRHTGATYYNAYYGKVATAALLTHEGTTLVFKHYVGVTTRKAAAAFFAIVPTSIVFKPGTVAYGSIAKIPKEELAKLVWTKPIDALAKDIGCNPHHLSRHCFRLGIKKPGPAHWAKARYRREVQKNENADAA